MTKNKLKSNCFITDYYDISGKPEDNEIYQLRKVNKMSELKNILQSKKFKGTLVITDPCYIIRDEKDYKDFTSKPEWNDYHEVKDYNGLIDNSDPAIATEWRAKLAAATAAHDEADRNWEKINPDDWDKCEFGENMEALGIHTYLTNSTEYGDWSCTVFSSPDSKELGDFCADAGLVSVFLLEELREYNSKIDKWLEEHKWCATVIPNWDGDVYIVNQTGGKSFEADIRVIGVSKELSFYSKQTGM